LFRIEGLAFKVHAVHCCPAARAHLVSNAMLKFSLVIL